MLKISDHITYAEATKSQVAVRYNLKNVPNQEQLENMTLTAEKIFEPVREFFNYPIAVTSFFRAPAVNPAAGGARNSQHSTGQAMDIDADVLGKITNKQVFDYIRENLEFDQLIWEFGDENQPDWVHVSYNKVVNRRQILRSLKQNYKTIYTSFK